MSRSLPVHPQKSPQQEDSRTLACILGAYCVSATCWLLFATGVGTLLAYKFGAPDFAAGAWLTFGRLRPVHTNATFYGWASIALVGLAYYVAARSSRTSLYSVKLAWVGLVLFNVAAVAGTVALDLGYNDGNLEYREWPWPVRLVFLAALVVTAWNLVRTVACTWPSPASPGPSLYTAACASPSGPAAARRASASTRSALIGRASCRERV